MNFEKWLRTFIEEKELEGTSFDFKTNGVFNIMPIGTVIEFTAQLSEERQYKIKETLVKIDFKNGDVLHYLKHLARGISLTQY